MYKVRIMQTMIPLSTCSTLHTRKSLPMAPQLDHLRAQVETLASMAWSSVDSQPQRTESSRSTVRVARAFTTRDACKTTTEKFQPILSTIPRICYREDQKEEELQVLEWRHLTRSKCITI